MTQVFNRPAEVAVRILYILQALNGPVDLQKLVYFDYLTLHYGDVDPTHTSLHPANPFHATEYVVRRGLVQEGLDFAVRKGLVSVKYGSTGVLYEANENSSTVLGYMDSGYSRKLAEAARLVCLAFSEFSDRRLSRYFKDNLGRWTGEFEKESLFRGDLNG